MPPPPLSFQIAIDTGGTFTDCIAQDSTGRHYRRKVLSNSTLRGTTTEWLSDSCVRLNTNFEVSRDIFAGYSFHSEGFEATVSVFEPKQCLLYFRENIPPHLQKTGQTFSLTAHEEAPILGARLITETALHEDFPPIQMKLGSTKGTNALLEHRGAAVDFYVSEGFKDLLVIGNQARPNIFSLEVRKPKPLHNRVIEVAGVIDSEGRELSPLSYSKPPERKTSAAICLKNAYINPTHEQALATELRKHYDYVSVSTELSSQIKFLHRAETAVVNAYLAPIIHEYLDKIAKKLPPQALQVMTSAGHLIRNTHFEPKDSLFSGPAGGLVGAAKVAKASGFTHLITFDMGGTSTDVARYDGDFDFQTVQTIGNAQIFSPALAIETVAAGGGSICYYDGHKLCVGPASAGANPGPACYGAGGPLTITDVNLLLGRLDGQAFSIPITPQKAQERLHEILEKIKQQTGILPQSEEILEGFMAIANEKMAEAVRKISIAKGYDPRQYALVAFGGAGGLHACAIAQTLGIHTILLPQDAGLLSAYGISQAPIERLAEKSVLKPFTIENQGLIQTIFEELCTEATQKVGLEGIEPHQIQIRKRSYFLRLKGQEASIEVEVLANESEADLAQKFKQKYQQTYGYYPQHRAIEIESLRVIAVGMEPENEIQITDNQNTKSLQTRHHIASWVENTWQKSPVYERESIPTDITVNGFALILDQYSTTVLEKNWALTKDKQGTLILRKQSEVLNQHTQHEAVELELFTNRFTAIAENMGVMLQRTSLSVNVKERLDFSCALLDARGELIANAPHIPVHLGSLGVCVRSVMQAIDMQSGDVIITNHPAYGGSHLPDVTLITPVFGIGELVDWELGTEELGIRKVKNKNLSVPQFPSTPISQFPSTPISHFPSTPISHFPSTPISQFPSTPTTNSQLLGFVVNRCHHAEIGGIRPASMPPNATNLAQEGVVIPPTKLVEAGVVRWDMMRELLTTAPYPTRNVEENLADLNAALAANRNGEQALIQLVSQHGTEKVQHYMELLKAYSAQKMQERLTHFTAGIYTAEECLDDGSRLKCTIEIAPNGTATIDFTGTAGVHKGNLNGNEAIVQSVVVYVLRTLLQEKIPLNDGILKPVRIIIPENSILKPVFSDNPADCPAVVGGNVELSQRLTDTLLKAFGVVACSQGTMNNTLFGNENFGYYETICGGCGAGEGFDGASGVHHHMTNTRITDPEIMELRYPVRLHRFEIRENSGGKGQWNGGDGIVREIEFLAPVELSILSQHRQQAPYGMHGGQNGAIGQQYIIRKEGTIEILEGIAEASVLPHDRLVMQTPGGGGWKV